MKVAIIGLGRLGLSVKECAQEAGHEVCFMTRKPLTSEDKQALKKAQLIFILVPPKPLLSVSQTVASLNIPTVIGTTSWPDHEREAIFDVYTKYQTPMLYGSNFSPSIILMKKSLELFLKASKKMDETFVLSGFESHHAAKVDGPSGTAHLFHDALKGYSKEVMPPFTYERKGDEKGYHQINMENKGNVLSWSHRAKDRQIFAKGALLAGLWLCGKQGTFTFENYVESLL